MYKRSAEEILHEALSISPTVLLLGARQVGKSTLCLSLDNEYRVFDNLTAVSYTHLTLPTKA